MSNRKWQCEYLSWSFLDGGKSPGHHSLWHNESAAWCLSSVCKNERKSERFCSIMCVCMGMSWEWSRQPDQSPDTDEQRNGKRESVSVCVCVSVCEKGNPCLFVWGFSSEKELLQLHKHTNTLVVLALLELTRAVEDLIMPGILKLKLKLFH